MISIVAAIGKNRELGKDNKLLWNIPEDLKRFRQLTSGHPIIMGRKTFESIGRVLPNRLNIIITRDEQKAKSDKKYEGAIIVESLEKAIEVGNKYEEKKSIPNTKYKLLNTEHEVFIIGGGQIFAQALPIVDKLYLTIVDAAFDADTFFPPYEMFAKVRNKEEHRSDTFSYTFLTLTK